MLPGTHLTFWVTQYLRLTTGVCSYPEDEGSRFLQNVGNHPADCTASNLHTFSTSSNKVLRTACGPTREDVHKCTERLSMTSQRTQHGSITRTVRVMLSTEHSTAPLQDCQGNAVYRTQHGSITRTVRVMLSTEHSTAPLQDCQGNAVYRTQHGSITRLSG